MALVGGIEGPTPQEGKILCMLERGGVFLAGTPAFRVLGAQLGVAWNGQFATRDVDIAIENSLPVAGINCHCYSGQLQQPVHG
ncbi:MAG: hypothetical protein GY770_07005 [Aestuariibacter sp.]|nr:hypothetical protein [Aestuariibacter sp.]